MGGDLVPESSASLGFQHSLPYSTCVVLVLNYFVLNSTIILRLDISNIPADLSENERYVKLSYYGSGRQCSVCADFIHFLCPLYFLSTSFTNSNIFTVGADLL